MTIYVVEFIYDYTEQLGFSTSKQVAEKKAKEFAKKSGHDTWVRPYSTNKNNWAEFCGD